ncbi:MAG: hypothetical protein ACI4BD_04035 [Paludibacteraceae bacterium]
MKTNIISLAFISLLILSSCKHETIYPTRPQPDWQVESNVDMRYSMTMVGALPEHLLADADTADLVAAFVVANPENSAHLDTLCCGLTRLTAIPSGNANGETGTPTLLRAFLYITLPTGVADDCQIILRYYATRTRYLYQSDATVSFQSDAIIGNITDPYEIPFGNPL